MQSPTPPTKPTPPTPPSMKPSATSSSTDIHSPVTATPQSITPSKAVSASKEQSVPSPAAVLQPNNNLPPQSSFSPSNHTSKETASEIAIPSTTNLSKNNSSSIGFSVFFILIFIIGIALVAVHWWKRYKPKRESIIDYNAESSDEIVNLILSQNTPDSLPQTTAITNMSKKIFQKAEPMPKSKGNFEVRV